MASRFTFPLRFLNKEILNTICNYYNINVGRIEILDDVLILNKPFLETPQAYMDEVASQERFVECYEELVHLSNYNHSDDDQNRDFVELFQSLKLPYDSLQGDELQMHCYRPEIQSKPFSLAYHPTTDTLVFPIDIVSDILYRETDMDVVMKRLAEAYKQFGGSVPSISTYTTIEGHTFLPLAIRYNHLDC